MANEEKLDLDKKININNDFLYKKGLCGLTNLGNTCFMNSIIQCLNNTIPLLTYFMSNEYKDDINMEKPEAEIAIIWSQLSRALWFRNAVCTPDNFLRIIQENAMIKGYGHFTGFEQNDSQEFLQFFLESLHTALSGERDMNITGEIKSPLDKLHLDACKSFKNYFENEYSEIINIFYGQYYSRITTHNINTGKREISENFEPFSTLSLEIPNLEDSDLNIYNCLDNFSKNEELDTDNKNINKFKECLFWSLPDILIILFKRFDNSGNKINTCINFPIKDLSFQNYIKGYPKEREKKYDLYAVSNHSGNTMGGHYFSYVKNKDNNWYKYNDNIVSSMSEEEVVSSFAYCLFYAKK
jgi:ubiquitin C-terminal hydrolase